MNLPHNQFTDIVKARRSTRHFEPKAVAPELIEQLLEAARWSPSGFNLQPTHFVVVTDQALKEKLYPACMKQRQVLDAGAVVVFTGDRDVVTHHFEKMLRQDREAKAINADYEKFLRKNVPLSFDRGFLGFGFLWKLAAEMIVGRFVPIPKLQAIHRDYWLAKQASIAAQTFMLAAQVAGLATCPMEGFSERAVRKVLDIPRHQAVILIVPVGYANNSAQTKTRLSLAELVHHNSW
ncbi:MAG: nitroreductase family protein [Pyrinomonadaceae bacterium]